MATPPTIRYLQPGDEHLLGTLAWDAADFEEDDDPASDQTQQARPLGDEDAAAFLADPATHLWVAMADEGPVGFLLAHTLRRRHGDPLRLFIYEVGVRSGWRRRGIGTALIGHALAFARDAGIAQAFLMASEHNTPAIAFYEAQGWTSAGSRDLVFSIRIEEEHVEESGRPG